MIPDDRVGTRLWETGDNVVCFLPDPCGPTESTGVRSDLQQEPR